MAKSRTSGAGLKASGKDDPSPKAYAGGSAKSDWTDRPDYASNATAKLRSIWQQHRNVVSNFMEKNMQHNVSNMRVGDYAEFVEPGVYRSMGTVLSVTKNKVKVRSETGKISEHKLSNYKQHMSEKSASSLRKMLNKEPPLYEQYSKSLDRDFEKSIKKG